MARLRFPGRPGYRFDRHGVRYGADEVKHTKDPSLAIVAYIHQGLRQFRELFGESDEEEEFVGFFPKDYKRNERRLASIMAVQNSQAQQITPEHSGTVGTRFAKAKDSIAALPTSERTRGRMKIVIRQSYKQLISSGLAKPTKSHMIGSIKEVERMKSTTRPPEKKKMKVIRIRISHKKGIASSGSKILQTRKIGRPSSTSVMKEIRKRGRPPKVALPEMIAKKIREAQKPTKVEKKVAKQLILKAKGHTGLLSKTTASKSQLVKTPIPKTSPQKSSTPQGSKLPMHGKKFVLPVMSSRSSRIIIPNKRFLHDDGFSTALLAKRPVAKKKSDSFTGSSGSKKLKLSSPKLSDSEQSFSPHGTSKRKSQIKKSVSGTASPASVTSTLNARSLITSTPNVTTYQVNRKGQKQMVKIVMKEIESCGADSTINISDDEQSRSDDLFPRSPLAPSKLEVFNRAGPMSLPGYNRQRFDSAAHKSRDFLRKAKLQLNRTTLNRSKAALARSLKAKMKREAKVEEERERMRQFSPSSPTSPLRLSPVGSVRSLAESQLSPSRIFDTGQGLSKEQSFGQNPTLKVGTIQPSKVSKELAFESKCAICGDPNLIARTGLYYGIPSCYGCSQFYRKEAGSGSRFVCSKSGNCEITKLNKRKCLSCWFRMCGMFYPAVDKMKQSSPEKSRKVLPESKMTPLALDLSDHDNYQPSAFSPSSLSFGVSTPAKSPSAGFSPKYVSTACGPGMSSVNVSPSFLLQSPETTPDKSPSKVPPGDVRGPRIKHVCRRAAMVLKKPVAKFPSPPSLRLSALPSLEKERIFQANRDAKANDSSDDDRPMEDIIKSAKSDEVVIIHRKIKKTPKSIVQSSKYQSIGKRKLRCRTCVGCRKPECGRCIYCRDKTKNGGPNLIKQACVERKCLHPIYKRAATNSFVMQNLKGSEQADDDGDDNICDDNQNVPVPKNSEGNPSSSNTSQIARYLGGREAQQGEVTVPRAQMGDGLSLEHSKQSSLEMPKRGTRLREKAVTTMQQAIVQPVLNVLRKPPLTSGLSKDVHLIKADFKEDMSLNFSWAYGMALTMMKPTCVRTVCFLCGSAGKHELIFCMACCEPFHMFCLSEDERPEEENMENWCCRKCQFCNVCGHQNNLLQCDRCQSTYHPECLGPNYPTRPSRQKNIWVCMKCVRCKSCGATTPGNCNSAIWMYDFSLCYECGQLMDKGNFCPVCHKCYSDDDWESKMVECAVCKSWVHAKCEELSDEMYQVLSELPEDVHYTCKMCCTERPAHWEVMLNEAFYGGLKSVLLGLLNMKCSHHLINIDPEKEKRLQENKKKLSPKSKAAESTHKQNTRSKSHMENISQSDTSPTEHIKPSLSGEDKCASMETDSGSSVSKSPTQTHGICKEPRNIFNTIAMEIGISSLDGVSDGREESVSASENNLLEKSSLVCDTEFSDQKTISESKTIEGSSTEYVNEKSASTKYGSVEFSCNMRPVSELTNKTDASCLETSSNVDFINKQNQEIQLTHDESDSINEQCSVASTSKKYPDIVSTNEKCSKSEAANESTVFSDVKVDAALRSTESLKANPADETSLSSDVEMTDVALSPEVAENNDDFFNRRDLIRPILRSGGTPDSQISMKVRYDPTENMSDMFDDSPEKNSVLDSLDVSVRKTADHSVSASVCETGSQVMAEKTTSTQNESVLFARSELTNPRVMLSEEMQSTSDTDAMKKRCDSEIQESKCDSERRESNWHSEANTVVQVNVSNSKLEIKVDNEIKQDEDDINKTVMQETNCVASLTNSEMDDSEQLKEELINSVEKTRESQTASSSNKTGAAASSSDWIPATVESLFSAVQTEASGPFTSLVDISNRGLEKAMVVDGAVSDSTETLSHPSEPMSSPEGVPISSKKAGVHFLSPKTMDYLNKRMARREFPKDFAAVREKLEANLYKTVEEFSEDMVNIIQAALNMDDTVTRKKMTNSVRSTFIKQMEKAFPWFNVNTCKLWEHNRNLPDGMLPDAVLPPTDDHTYAQWLEREELPISPQPSPFKRLLNNPVDKVVVPMAEHSTASFDDEGPVVNAAEVVTYASESDYDGEDTRRCVLCSKLGDEFPDEAGRLLYVGQNDWAHVNCALWSAEVFEERDGCLQNVHSAITRGKKLLCDLCGKSGATVGCCSRGCSGNFHFACARLSQCVFQEDKKVYCRLHGDQAVGEMVHHGGFSVLRRVSIDMDGRYSKKSWNKGINPSLLSVLIGSCTVESLGQLEPLSDRSDFLLPVDFVCSRVYWSTKDARRRCIYTCRITEFRPTITHPEVKIQDMTIIHDKSHPDFIPLHKLDLKSLGLPSLMDSSSRGGDDVIFVSESLHFVSSSAAITSQTSAIVQTSRIRHPCSTENVSGVSDSRVFGGETLKSPPLTAGGFNLDVLSPNTLKYLGSAALTKMTHQEAQIATMEDDFGNLTKMVDRLNNAASRVSGKRPPSSGVAGKRPASAERTFSEISSAPIGKLRRASSCDNPSLLFRQEILKPLRSFTPSFSLQKNVDLNASKSLSENVTMKVLEIEETDVAHQIVSSVMEGSRPQPISSTVNEGSSASPIKSSVTEDCSAHPIESSVTEESSAYPVGSSVTEGSSDQPVNCSRADLEEITEEQALVDKVLSNMPPELLDECEGQTIVVLTEDAADLTEEEMIRLAQSALETEDGTDATTFQDQSDSTTTDTVHPLIDGEVDGAKETASWSLGEKEICEIAEGEVVAKKVYKIESAVTEGEAVDAARQCPERPGHPLNAVETVTSEVYANSNLFAETEIIAKKVCEIASSLAEGQVDKGIYTSTSLLDKEQAVAKEVHAITSLFAEKQAVAKEVHKNKSSLAEKPNVAVPLDIPRPPNVPKIVEEILSKDFGVWMPRATSDNCIEASEKTLEKDLLCNDAVDTAVVQKGGGNENLMKRPELDKDVGNEPGAKRKRNVNLVKHIKSKTIGKNETLQNLNCRTKHQDTTFGSENVVIPCSVLQNVENTVPHSKDTVRIQAGSASEPKVLHKNISDFSSSLLVPSHRNSKVKEDIQMSKSSDCLNSDFTNTAEDTSNLETLKKAVPVCKLESVPSRLSNAATEMNSVEKSLLSQGSKYVEPVYVRGKMIGYHVMEKKETEKEVEKMHATNVSCQSREATLMKKTPQETVNSEMSTTSSSLSSEPSRKKTDSLFKSDLPEQTCRVTSVRADQLESRTTAERRLESTEERESKVDIDHTINSEMHSREVTDAIGIEHRGIQKPTASSDVEVYSEIHSPSKVSGIQKVKPTNIQELANCVDDKGKADYTKEVVDSVDKAKEVDAVDKIKEVDSVDKVKEVDSVDRAKEDNKLRDGVSTRRDVCSKKDKTRKEPVKKYPLRRTIQRVIGDIDMEELSINSAKTRSPKQKTLASVKESSFNDSAEKDDKDKIPSMTNDKSVVQVEERDTVRRTRSRSGNIMNAGDRHSDVKFQNVENNTEKLKAEDDENHLDQPCLIIEKLSKAVIHCVNKEHDSDIEAIGTVTSEQVIKSSIEKESIDTVNSQRIIESLNEKESVGKVTTRRVSVRIEKLADTVVKSEASEQETKEKEFTAKISSRRTSLRSENAKKLSDIDVKDDTAKSGHGPALHEKIAERIKAESIAKSSPSEKGPFKCSTCKRSYRTEESYNAHIEDCNFEVSTSDEEEDDQSVDRKSRMSRNNSTEQQMNDCYVKLDGIKEKAEGVDDQLSQDHVESVMEDSSKVNPEESENRNCIENKSKMLSPESSSETVVHKRGRGRPPKPKTTEVTSDSFSPVESEHDPVKRSRGRPPKTTVESSEALNSPTPVDESDAPTTSKKRGRPRKYALPGENSLASELPESDNILKESVHEGLQSDSSWGRLASEDEGEATLHTKRWVKVKKSKLTKCLVTKWSSETCNTIQSICPKDPGENSLGKKRHRKRRKRSGRVSSNVTENGENSSENHNEEVIIVQVETSSNSEHEADIEPDNINTGKNIENKDSGPSVAEVDVPQKKASTNTEQSKENESKSPEDCKSVDGNLTEIHNSNSSKSPENRKSVVEDGKEAEESGTSKSNVDSAVVVPSAQRSIGSPSKICQGLKEKLGRKTPEILADVSSRRASNEKKELDDSCDASIDSNLDIVLSTQSSDCPFLDELTGEMMNWINGKLVPVVDSTDERTLSTDQVKDSTDKMVAVISPNEKDLDGVTSGTNTNVNPRNIFDVLSVGSAGFTTQSLESKLKRHKQASEKGNMVESAHQAIPEVIQALEGTSAGQIQSHVQSDKWDDSMDLPATKKGHPSIAGAKTKGISPDVPARRSLHQMLSGNIPSQTPRPSRPLIPSPLTIGNQASHGVIPKPLAIRRPAVADPQCVSPQSSVPKSLNVSSGPFVSDKSRTHHSEGSTKIAVETPGQKTQHVDCDSETVVVFPSQIVASKINEKMGSSSQDDSNSFSASQDSIKIATEILRQKYLDKQKHQSAVAKSPVMNTKIATSSSVVHPPVVSHCVHSGQASATAMQQNKASIIETALRQLQQINPGLVNTAAQQLGYQAPTPQVNQLNVASLQIPYMNNQSNISSLQMAGVGSQSTISPLQMTAVNNQSNVSSLQMSGMSSLQMSNVPVQASPTGQYSSVQTNAGLFIQQNVGEVNSTDMMYQQQLQTDTSMLHRLTSAFQQMSSTLPTPNMIQQIPGILQTPQIGALHAAAASSVIQAAPLLQCAPNILQQTASLVQPPNQTVLRHPELLQTPGGYGLSTSNVSYMGSFILPKMGQGSLGSGAEINPSMMTSQMSSQISDNIMNCFPSPLIQQSGIASSVQNIGMSSTGRPVIKVVIENQDGGNSHLPLPVQDIVKTIAASQSSPEPTTSVKVVCRNTNKTKLSEQTIYSRLPASSLIQSMSQHASGSVCASSSRSSVQLTSTSSSSSSSSRSSSPPRVLKYSLPPSSPNLRKILSSRVGVGSHPTMSTSSSGLSQKVVMSRINVLKKLLSKPNILHRKRHQANPAEGTPAHKRQMISAEGRNEPKSVKYIMKHPDKDGQQLSTVEGRTGHGQTIQVMSRRTFQGEKFTDQTEVVQTTACETADDLINVGEQQTQMVRIEKRKIVQKFTIPGFLEDLLLKPKTNRWGEGHGITKPDINRALLDLARSSIPSSPSSTSSSQGNIVTMLQKKINRGTSFGRTQKSDKLKRPPKKGQTLLDKSKSCTKKASDYTKLKLGKKAKTSRRKSPVRVRNVCHSPSAGHISHPLIHHQNEATCLPQPAMEEEVREIPLSIFELNRGRSAHNRDTPKDAPHLVFEITSDDGFHCRADTMEDAWKEVLNKTQDSRAAARMKSLSYNGIRGRSMFGVDHHAVIYLLEQLYGASHCHRYSFKYHRHTKVAREEEPPLTKSGCIRAEPFTTRKEFDMFSFLMSQYRERPKSDNKQNQTEMTHKSARRTTSLELPMAMRFRKLQEHAKEAVGAYRSNIHGRGLFCKRNIDAGEMVIEYAGEVIRASLTDKREKYYESKGIGCYMFRIDDYDVVDATMHGSAARFINHSCEPNCYSKVINVDGRKHIVIFAGRQILRGEELTYDYKFPIEEVKMTVSCHICFDTYIT
ncbi:uncharacterized protein LOC121386787 isoform X2 [Gigantopelta aegis]|uniref:uncharacterized protein LOC121386787 isoform X2 n=1 Tax=Gigantopelta aegis TaxID=1735272 RepID=UPI001B88B46E|nr:uncharacterized protein LOC121386787 isoform X2 [Gigantopelta aegis]